MNTRLWQILNVLAAVFALTMNGLANGLPLFGRTTGELSDLYPNLFVPAGLTFSIWGLIYLLLIGLLIYQFRDLGNAKARNDVEGLVRALSPWLVINLIANGLWIVAWHATQLPLSLGLMLVILISLVQLNIRLDARKPIAPANEKWFTRLFVSVYLGWISVATIANVTALLVNSGITGGEMEAALTAGMILIAVMLGFVFIWQRGDWAYGLVIVWALLGILIKRNAIADSPSILFSVLYAGLAILVIRMAIRIFRPGPMRL